LVGRKPSGLRKFSIFGPFLGKFWTIPGWWKTDVWWCVAMFWCFFEVFCVCLKCFQVLKDHFFDPTFGVFFGLFEGKNALEMVFYSQFWGVLERKPVWKIFLEEDNIVLGCEETLWAWCRKNHDLKALVSTLFHTKVGQKWSKIG